MKKTRWFIAHEKGKPFICREVTTDDGKKRLERYPREKYKHLLHDPNELQKFVLKLNGLSPNKIISQRPNLQTQLPKFISESDLDGFREELRDCFKFCINLIINQNLSSKMILN